MKHLPCCIIVTFLLSRLVGWLPSNIFLVVLLILSSFTALFCTFNLWRQNTQLIFGVGYDFFFFFEASIRYDERTRDHMPTWLKYSSASTNPSASSVLLKINKVGKWFEALTYSSKNTYIISVEDQYRLVFPDQL